MQKVLCIYSLLVEVSDFPEAADETLTEVTQVMKDSLRKAFAHYRFVQPPQGAKYVWIDSEPNGQHLNIYSCAICGNLGTDWSQPDMLHGIREGRYEDGKFICDACRDEQTTTANVTR